MKTNKENDELIVQKLIEQKNELQAKLQETKKKLEDKQQRVVRMKEKKINLDQENKEITKFHNRLINKREEMLANRPAISTNQNDVQEEESDVKEFEMKLEDKVEFILEQYLTELELMIKKDIKEYNKSVVGDNSTGSVGEQAEYQKSSTKSVCIQNIINMNKKGLSSDDKMGIAYNTFKISKKTKVSQLKEAALAFWQIPNFHKPEVQDQYELVDIEKNPLQFTGDESDVDSVLAKLIDLKLSTLILRKKEDKQAGNESEVDGGDNGKKKELSKEKIQQEMMKYKSNEVLRHFDKFFKNLPAFRPFFSFYESDIAKKSDSSQVKIGLKFDDYSCLTILIIIALLVMTIYGLNKNGSLQSSYVHSEKLQFYMGIKNDIEDYTFLKVNSFYDFQQFLTTTQFSYQLFTDQLEIKDNYYIVGRIRIRQVRTIETPCQNSKSQMTCYHQYYTELTKEKHAINNGNHDYEMYQNTVQSGTSSSISGQFYSYDSSGYILDIPQATSRGSYVVMINDMIKNNVLSHPSIRAIFVQFTLMNNVDGSYIKFDLVLENTTYGVFPSVILSVFSKESFSDDFKCMRDPKFYINVFFSLFFLVQFFNNGLAYFFSVVGLLNVAVQIFIYITVFEECILIEPLSQTYTSDDYVDLQTKADKYNLVIIFASLSCAVILIRIAFVMEYSNSFGKIMSAVDHGLKSLYIQIGFLILLISSMALILMNQWGQTVKQANTFIKAFFSMLLIMTGCFDYSQITYDYPFLIFFAATFLLFAFFFMNILTITHIDNYRQIVMLYGEQYVTKYTFKDNVKWLLTWMPQKLQKRILGEL